MKILFLLLILAVPSFAQEIPDFVYIGKHEKIAFFVDPVNVTPKGDRIWFNGLAGVSLGQENKLEVIDHDNYILSVFEADCKTYQYRELAQTGIMKGEKFSKNLDRQTDTAKAPSVIFYALERVCKVKNLEI